MRDESERPDNPAA